MNLRKEDRFKVREGAFAASDTSPCEVGQIMDISMHGLAFCYIADKEETAIAFHLDIFLTQNGFYLRKVPVQTVWDLEMINTPPFSMVPMRRRGVQFGFLNSHQKRSLKYFITNYTTDKVS